MYLRVCGKDWREESEKEINYFLNQKKFKLKNKRKTIIDRAWMCRWKNNGIVHPGEGVNFIGRMGHPLEREGGQKGQKYTIIIGF